MSRINTNVGALVANTNLAKSQGMLSKSLERLSSGLRINSGADDPAGLIISQQLRSEIQGIQSAMDNSTRAINVISTADAALGEVSNLLISIKGLVVQAANTGGMTADEIKANQMQVDSAIQSITRIANSTTFGGRLLLNGSLGYITSGVVTSALHDVKIDNVSFGTASVIPVSVNVLRSAQQAELFFRQSSVAKSVTIEVFGSIGVQELKFISGTSVSEIVDAINRVSDSTGVSAKLTSAMNLSSGLTLTSSGFGSKNFVSVTVRDNASFVTETASGATQQRAHGQDAIASINGNMAIGDGLQLSLNTASLTMSLNLDAAFGTGTQSFTITGGGAVFQLGSHVQSNQQIGIALDSIAASHLGNAAYGYLTDLQTGGFASLATSPNKASRILEAAVDQVSMLRGRLGAFEQNTLQTNINSLQVALENVSSSASEIMDTDFAAETSNLTRTQILVQAGVSVLAQANMTPQAVLKLLG